MLPRQILFIDDNAALAAAYQLSLGDLGLRVITASSGAEAITVCNKPGETSLAIVDLKMPGMDGPTTIEALHQQQPGMKVIAISGQLLGPYFGRLADLGVRHFLCKPFSLEALLESIRQVQGLPESAAA